MRIFSLVLFSALFLITPAHADNADSPFKGGMKNTTFGTSGIIKSRNQDEAAVKTKTFTPATPTTFEKKDEPESISKIWAKYRDLAAGKATEPKEEPKPDVENTELELEEKQEPQKKTSFTSILDQYQESNKRQGQINTINIQRPKLPQKPVVD